MPENDRQLADEKSFWGHLDDLRSMLFKIIGVLVVFMAVFFVFMPHIFDRVVLAPCHGDFVLYRVFARITAAIPGLTPFDTENFDIHLINVKLTSQFFIHMSTSFWLAVTFAFPFILYFLWAFVKPALYENERHGARTAFALGSVMFFLGIAVGYFVVFPVSLRFLYTYELSPTITNALTLDSYMDTFLTLNFIMGIVFELPLLAWTLSAVGILRRSFFRRYRRHAIVALIVLAAIITPTGDPFTLAVVFLPLYLLYEGSALVVRKDTKKQADS